MWQLAENAFCFALGAVVGWAFGYALAYHHTMLSLKPCHKCGTTKQARHTYGPSETWQCEDQDGCQYRCKL